ncbi:MAG: SpoIVB peptidase S55 domain-containing protein [Sellimonas intestinalis]
MTDEGIYGTVDRIDALFSNQEPVPVAAKEEIHTGDAVIRCAVSGKVEEKYKDSYCKKSTRRCQGVE